MAGSKSYHFVLVHGACHGAWCWYKTKDLLEKAGHKATALDLAACGVNTADLTRITSFEHYNQPLVDFLGSLDLSEKVILVGHSLGGLSLVDASGIYPDKITVAVYLSALMMLANTEDLREIILRHSDYFTPETLSDKRSWIDFPDDVALKIFYNLSPSQDVVLSGLLRRPLPLCCLSMELKHAKDKIESVHRVFVKLEKDNALNLSFQDELIQRHPPDHVFSLDTDHSPFFSMPQELHDLLLKIAHIYDP